MDFQVGEAAGRVWHFLEQHPQSTFEQTYKFLSVEPTLFYMAVGWLAREDKLSFEGEGRKRKLSLKQGANGSRS
jgi:hypothetical protein